MLSPLLLANSPTAFHPFVDSRPNASGQTSCLKADSSFYFSHDRDWLPTQVIRVLSSFLRVSGDLVTAVCGGCLICFEGFMRQFNLYGFILVAVYGFDYSTASTKSYALITEHGMRGMMLDDIVAATVVIGGLGVGATAVAACWIGLRVGLAPGYEDYSFVTTLFLPSFILGFLVGLMILEALESVICTIYTCFAEEPRTLEITDPSLYNELREQWYAGMDVSPCCLHRPSNSIATASAVHCCRVCFAHPLRSGNPLSETNSTCLRSVSFPSPIEPCGQTCRTQTVTMNKTLRWAPARRTGTQ